MNEFAGRTNPSACLRDGIYGRTNPMAMMVQVEATRTRAARLWRTGILAVRRRCTIMVWVRRLDWKRKKERSKSASSLEKEGENE